MDAKFMGYLDKSIKTIWLQDLKQDYLDDNLLKEDTLKNAFYYHLRNRLNNYNQPKIKIYTEFTDSILKGTGLRADIAVVKLKDEFDKYYLGDNVEELLVVIELKYKDYRCKPWVLMNDIDKIRKYIKKYHMINCQFYLGFIHEYNYPISEMKWLTNRESSSWAKGKVTELSACKIDGRGEDMKFFLHSYNNLNEDLNYSPDIP